MTNLIRKPIDVEEILRDLTSIGRGEEADLRKKLPEGTKMIDTSTIKLVNH